MKEAQAALIRERQNIRPPWNSSVDVPFNVNIMIQFMFIKIRVKIASWNLEDRSTVFSRCFYRLNWQSISMDMDLLLSSYDRRVHMIFS